MSLEESSVLQLDFQKLKKISNIEADVLPVIVQDYFTLKVLILAYVNEEALELSIKKKKAVFYSTSRNEIWEKGKSSGDTLQLLDIRVNCEQNSLLFLVKPKNTGACHTKNQDGKARISCYYRRLEKKELKLLEK